MKNIRNIIRVIIVILVFFLFFNKEIRLKRYIKPFGVLLIDGSKSMYGLKIPSIKTGYKTIKIVFNKNQTKTEIGNAILDCVNRYPDLSFIILYSDGNNNSGIDPLDVVRRLNVPIYVILPEFQDIPQVSVKKYKDFLRVGDTAYFYITSSKDVSLEIKEDEVLYSTMNLKKDIEFKVGYYSEKEGVKNLSFIFRNEYFVDTIFQKVTYLPKIKYSIQYSKPDWNVRFIKRIIEDKGFTPSKIGDLNFFILNEKDEMIEKNLSEFYRRRLKLFVVISYQSDINFIPFNKFSIMLDSLNRVYFNSLLPFFTQKNSKELRFLNKRIGYFNEDFTLFQSTILDIWKLSFSAIGLEDKDYLSEIIDSVIFFMGLREKEIIIPDTVNSKSEFYIYSNGLNADYIQIDSLFVPYSETLLVYPLNEGMHIIRFIGRDTTTKSIYAINPYEDKKGINRVLLEDIVKVSNGKFIKNEFFEDFGRKKKEIIVDIRHSIYSYLIIILLLSINWYLWMKER